MRRSLGYVLALMVSALLLLASCRRDEAKVIPRNELAKIYAEMLVTDQWILSTPNTRMIADTSLVYAPILEKYGYDVYDYLKTIDTYMDDPERFAKIFRSTGEILAKRISHLEKKKDELKKLAEIRKASKKFNPNIKFEEIFPYLFTERYIHYHDSIFFELDSAKFVYNMKSVVTADTLYEGINMIVKADTTAVADTVVVEAVVEEVKELKELPVNRTVKRANFSSKTWKLEE